MPSAGLPAPYNSFVGRRRELGEIAALSAGHRLVTLTGPGGSGKSRLAAEVARRLVDDGADDVRLIDLARLTAPALIGETVAQAFGIRPAQGWGAVEAIGAALSERDATILLDNCEHLVEAAAELVESLLGAAPRLRVLVTSREGLRVPGERVYAVGPLGTAVPGDRWDDIAGCEAVRLFVERASAASPGFTLSRTDAALVLEVCRRLDGLPLALELAAARTASMPLAALAERLDDRFRLLDPDDGSAGARHRSLAATMSWSYGLLSAQERLLLTRLTVFPGTFSLATAEAVVAGDDLPRRDVGLRLGRVVAVSTVQREDDQDGGTRYRLLETTREFGHEQLLADAAATLRERHARHVLGLAQTAAPFLLGPSSPEWLGRLHAENDNVRAALDWAFGTTGDPRLGAQLIAVLWHPWDLRGALDQLIAVLWHPWDLRGARDEGLHWVRAGLDALPDQDPWRLPLLSAGALFSLGRAEFDAVTALTRALLPAARSTGASQWAADALRMDAVVAWARGRFDRAQHLYEDAVRTALAGSDLWRAALAEAQLARLHRDRDEPDAARATAVRAIAHAEEVGEGLARGLAVDVLASVEERWGDRTVTQRLADEALVHYRRVGYTEGEASALQLLGRLALDAQDWAAARTAFDESLALCRRIGHPAGSAAALSGLARAAASVSDDERSGLLLGAAAALREGIGGALSGSQIAEDSAQRRRLTERLGAQRTTELLRSGAGLPVDELVAGQRRAPDDA
jgi:non-specific serine/threonine protein kinase